METIVGNRIHIYFDGMMDYFKHKDDVNTSHPNYSHTRSVLTRPPFEKDWIGPTNNSCQEAIDHAITGDHDLYESFIKPKIEKLNQAVHAYNADYTQQVPVVRRKRVKKSFGDELDIHQVYQGKLETAWSTTQRFEFDQEKHLVTILLDIGGNAHEDCLASTWNAAVCTKLINDLEIAGKNVQLILASNTEQTSACYRYHMTTAVPIKKYNERLSVERLSAMTHFGFFRTFGFIQMLTSSIKLNSGLGRCARTSEYNYPKYLTDEIELGHTKVILLKRSMNVNDAMYYLNDAYNQMKTIKENENV